MDNYVTHKHPKVQAWLERNPSFIPVAQGAKNVQATLFHAPPGTGDCQGNGVSGFPEGGFVNVHFNSQQDRLIFNFHVEGALPNTTYEVGIRCISILGDFTTNSQGEGDLKVKTSAAGIVPGTFALVVEGPSGGLDHPGVDALVLAGRNARRGQSEERATKEPGQAGAGAAAVVERSHRRQWLPI